MDNKIRYAGLRVRFLTLLVDFILILRAAEHARFGGHVAVTRVIRVR